MIQSIKNVVKTSFSHKHTKIKFLSSETIHLPPCRTYTHTQSYMHTNTTSNLPFPPLPFPPRPHWSTHPHHHWSITKYTQHSVHPTVWSYTSQNHIHRYTHQCGQVSGQGLCPTQSLLQIAGSDRDTWSLTWLNY